MITLTSVDVAKVLREIADKIEVGQVIPRQVTLGESRLEFDFDQRYRFEDARARGEGQ